MREVVAVRLSEPIRSALAQAARQAIVAELRRRGRLPSPAQAAAGG